MGIEPQTPGRGPYSMRNRHGSSDREPPAGAPTPGCVYKVGRFLTIFDCGRVLFGSRVAKREAEGTVHTKHELNLDPNPEGT